MGKGAAQGLQGSPKSELGVAHSDITWLTLPVPNSSDSGHQTSHILTSFPPNQRESIHTALLPPHPSPQGYGLWSSFLQAPAATPPTALITSQGAVTPPSLSFYRSNLFSSPPFLW